MIKKLSLKFVLVSLVLVVSVIITSSCYAFSFSTDYVDETPFTIEDLIEAAENHGCTFISNGASIHVACFKSLTTGNYSIRVLYGSSIENGDGEYFYRDGKFVKLWSSSSFVTCSSYSFSYVDNVLTCTNETGTSNSISYFGNFSDTNSLVVCDITTLPVRDSVNGTIIYVPSVAPDTSFDYSFEGIKRGQVKLNINNLNESLKMYGYVGLDTIFAVGDTLDITSNTVNLRLLASKSDNSDLNCYLYEGENLNYYIVDENNIILDTGYISEMANGYFLYGFEVNNGVDFVFLKDGQVYWDNNLTFKYSIDSGSQRNYNDIVSIGVGSYITTDKTVASAKYNGYVYDINNNLICETFVTISNDLTSPLYIEVDTNYYEDNLGYNEGVWCIYGITLSGTNSIGEFIDFSNYSVRWSIPTNVAINNIYVGNEKYYKRNGVFNGFSSAGYLPCYLYIRDYISEWQDDYVPFDIKLEIYDSEDNLVLTHTINSDDIIRDKVVSDENNVDKEDYDILDNPNYTGGSSTSPDINNIQNWTSDDYLNLMSTDNFVWEFFKAILGNLPWWITVPLTILIFGVVIITLIRFARGA